jgi:type I restriction enzyme, S subunit
MASTVAAWPMVPLGEVARPVERPELPVAGKLYRQVGVRLWGQGAYERESIDGGMTQYKTLSRVESDDVIVNKIWARNGSVSVVTPELAGCYVSGEFPTFAPLPDRLLPQWFGWLTKTRPFWEQCDEKSRGTSGKNRIRPEKFLEIEIPLPPLDEQRRIVAHIEALATRIEQARGLRREALAEAEGLLKAALDAEFEHIHALGCPMTTVAEMEEMVTSGPRNFSSRYTDQGYRFYRAQDITSGSQIASDGAVYVDIPQAMSTRAMVKPGDILVVITGATIGRSAVISPHHPQGLVSQHVGLVRVYKSKVNSHFLHYCILAPNWAGGQINEAKYGQGKPGLNLTNLRELRFPLPPMPIQQSVVDHLDEVKAQVERLKKLQTDATAELDALLPAVLDKAFRGEM